MESGFIMQKINATLRAPQWGLLRPIFDSHKKYSGQSRQMFDDFSKNNPLTSEFLLPPHYESDRDYLMLQVADNAAYEARRLLITEEFDTHIPERRAMKRLKERFYKIYKLNYEGLKAICEAQTPDKIPFEAEVHNKHEFINALETIEEQGSREERNGMAQ
jgi:hypothetical protein